MNKEIPSVLSWRPFLSPLPIAHCWDNERMLAAELRKSGEGRLEDWKAGRLGNLCSPESARLPRNIQCSSNLEHRILEPSKAELKSFCVHCLFCGLRTAMGN